MSLIVINDNIFRVTISSGKNELLDLTHLVWSHCVIDVVACACTLDAT